MVDDTPEEIPPEQRKTNRESIFLPSSYFNKSLNENTSDKQIFDASLNYEPPLEFNIDFTKPGKLVHVTSDNRKHSDGNRNHPDYKDSDQELDRTKDSTYKELELRYKLQEQAKDNDFKRKSSLIQQMFVGVTGILLICSGIFFTYRDEVIGPFFITLGAGAAGISTKDAAKNAKMFRNDDEDE